MDMNEIYKRLDEMFQNGQSALAEDYLIDSLKQAQAEGDYNSVIMLLNEMIGYCRETGQKEKSLAYSSQVIQLMQQLGMTDSVAYGTTLLNVANACRAAGRLEEAYRFYMEVFPVYEKYLPADDSNYAGLYNNMSLLFLEMGEFGKSVECLEKVLRIVEKIPGAEVEVAVTHTNIASSLCKLSEETAREEEAMRQGGAKLYYDKSRQLAAEALEEAKQAVEAFRSMEVMDVHMAGACTAYADALTLLGNYEEAAEYYVLAMSMIETAVGRTQTYDRVGEKLSYVRAIQSGEKLQKDQMSGMELSRAYFEAYGKKMLFDCFPEYLSRIAVGLCGEGSDCLGYDDAYSVDHDFGPGFALWVSDEVYDEIGEELQAAYDSLPKQFMGYERPETPRYGVCTYRQYLTRILGIDHVPKTDQEWLSVDEEALLAAVSGEVFADPSCEFSAIRDALKAYYPESVWRLKLAQQLTLFSRNGQYNYERMMKRGDQATANLLLAKAGENAMKLVYLLGRNYAPHTKWLLRGIEDMGQASMIEDLITSLLYEIGGGADAARSKSMQLEKIAFLLLEKLKSCGLVPQEATDTYLAHYAQTVAYGDGRGQLHTAGTEEKDSEEGIEDQTENQTENQIEDQTEDEAYTKEEMVDAIVQMEWKAFHQVKNEGDEADCQYDRTTFRIMRKSWYSTWNEEMLGQYIYDFSMKTEKDRNPITEKNARMMEQIIAIQVDWMESFAKAYPKVVSGVRAIYTGADDPYETSYETYLRGEIETYSDDMLMLYGRFIVALAKAGKNLVQMTMENAVHMYGYDSLDSAEEKMW